MKTNTRSYNRVDWARGTARNAFIFSRIIFALACCSMLLTRADAKEKKAKPSPTPASVHITIKSVSAHWITVNVPGGDRTYKITKYTEITFQGQTVTVHLINPGMSVEVTPDSVDQTEAGLIQADDPPPPPPAK